MAARSSDRRNATHARLAALAGALIAGSACGAAPPALQGLEAIYPSIEALYIDLHRTPEISLQEEKTAAKLAARLRELGYEVTERIGGHGVVGVLRNGEGPTVMLRTDTDALPVREQTGLPFASTATAINPSGETVPAMHACGHDAHMASWIGAAALLASSKDQWRGTVVFVGQPAEEIVQGARAMVNDGLFERAARPDYVVGIHVTNLLPAGQIGVISGPASAASNSVDITFFGKGGHGAAPHRAIDPILIASRAVSTLQSIVSREVNPLDPAVVTVGTFHAGTKRNIIPDQAKLELTVRSYKPEVQRHLLEAIERIARAEAAAAGAPREPLVHVHEHEASEVVVNDPALAARLMSSLRASLGEGAVVTMDPATTSEDFGVFGAAAGAPGVQLRVGAVNPEVFARAEAADEIESIPGPHNPAFAPDPGPTLRTGVAAFTLSALELLGKPGGR
ncbi:MAG: amidohydrolase [Phycisphaerales bacterium]|nr:amidohydrolase [Phycisphaerales bacterium]